LEIQKRGINFTHGLERLEAHTNQQPKSVAAEKINLSIKASWVSERVRAQMEDFIVKAIEWMSLWS